MESLDPERFDFNSQPHKEADKRKTVQQGFTEHFNSQPHKEADNNQQAAHSYYYISTHSLTRRLTPAEMEYLGEIIISTHSLTRRLTAILDKNIFIQN